ncbi:hypothetical protein D3C76_1452360 [compost metagenome]
MVFDKSTSKIYYCYTYDALQSDYSEERELITFYLKKDCELNIDTAGKLVSELVRETNTDCRVTG